MDFNRFPNSIRKEIYFDNPRHDIIKKNTDDTPSKPSSWKAPKSNIADDEVFLKLVEKYIFKDTASKKVKSNLTQEEGNVLLYCAK